MKFKKLYAKFKSHCSFGKWIKYHKAKTKAIKNINKLIEEQEDLKQEYDELIDKNFYDLF